MFAAGYDIGVIDGKFRPATQEAVMNFQNAYGLVCDGIVGPNTWNYLMSCVSC
ncbi:MAG: peptidoglycan-binding domain-containing protein [Cyanobacteria bacterium J06635_10]